MSDKPKVLVLGGVGFIGRNFVKYLLDNDLASYIRVVDKVLPSTSYLGPGHDEAFKNEKVEYKQGNLTSKASIAKCFAVEGGKFNYVFNCAAETKYGQTEEVYSEKVFDLSVRCAEEAVKQGVDMFVELSTAQVYDAGKKASAEDAKLVPWTLLAKHKLKAEESLSAMDGLPLVVLRPAIVYGPGDIGGLSPRVIVGAVYKHLGEKMKFLWGSSLAINTVHVQDVCKAMWHVSQKGKSGDCFNLADKNETDQGDFNTILEAIFDIKTDFYGKVMSNLAKVKLKEVTEQVNDKHLKPWSDLCKSAKIGNTPLTPYLDQELLYNNSLAVDGSAIEATGFTYDFPKVTKEEIRKQIDYFVSQNLFPANVLA